MVADTKARKSEHTRVYSVPSVEKCLQILELFQDASSQLSLTEILKATRIQKTTAFRILSTLESFGYVSKDSVTGKYQPALRLFELSGRLLSNRGILTMIRPYLENLQQRFSETVCLALRRNDRVIYASIVESSLSLRMVAAVGSLAPFHASALGKAVGAHLPEYEVQRLVLAQRLPSYTERTITDTKKLSDEYRLIREQGYADDFEEVEDGASCLGAAIFGYLGDPVGAISISGPTNRMRAQRADMIAAVKAAAKEISEKIGIALHIADVKKPQNSNGPCS
jgi:DNA-binding IclR family transcriptional regulator